MGTSMHFLPRTCRVLAPLQAVRLITPTPFLHLGRGSLGQVPIEKWRGAGQGTIHLAMPTPNTGHPGQVGQPAPLTPRAVLRASPHPSELQAASAGAEGIEGKALSILPCMVEHWTRL